MLLCRVRMVDGLKQAGTDAGLVFGAAGRVTPCIAVAAVLLLSSIFSWWSGRWLRLEKRAHGAWHTVGYDNQCQYICACTWFHRYAPGRSQPVCTTHVEKPLVSWLVGNLFSCPHWLSCMYLCLHRVLGQFCLDTPPFVAHCHTSHPRRYRLLPPGCGRRRAISRQKEWRPSGFDNGKTGGARWFYQKRGCLYTGTKGKRIRRLVVDIFLVTIVEVFVRPYPVPNPWLSSFLLKHVEAWMEQ